MLGEAIGLGTEIEGEATGLGIGMLGEVALGLGIIEKLPLGRGAGVGKVVEMTLGLGTGRVGFI